MLPQPAHVLLWLTCAAKRCCTRRTVLPTGGDIWRIATQLQISPASFLRTVPAEQAAPDGVLLAANAEPVHIALARRAVNNRQAACVFLMQIGDTAARCGLGDLRPLPCHAFPTTATHGALTIGDDEACTCRSWNLAELDRPAVMPVLEQEAAERDRDRQRIREWNLQISQRSPGSATLADFCDYLIEPYNNDEQAIVDKGCHD